MRLCVPSGSIDRLTSLKGARQMGQVLELLAQLLMHLSWTMWLHPTRVATRLFSSGSDFIWTSRSIMSLFSILMESLDVDADFAAAAPAAPAVAVVAAAATFGGGCRLSRHMMHWSGSAIMTEVVLTM